MAVNFRYDRVMGLLKFKSWSSPCTIYAGTNCLCCVNDSADGYVLHFTDKADVIKSARCGDWSNVEYIKLNTAHKSYREMLVLAELAGVKIELYREDFKQD